MSDAVNQHSCHSFSGTGYAVQDQIRHYDPRYYLLSLEFKTFDENAVLVVVTGQQTLQYMLLQIQDGRVRYSFRGRVGQNNQYGHSCFLRFKFLLLEQATNIHPVALQGIDLSTGRNLPS